LPPAIIAGGIAAAGTIGGAVLGSHAQNKAASQAADTEQQSTAAQLQLGRESLGLNQAIYNSNYNTLSPFVGRGNVAGDSINALLGLPNAPAMQSPLEQPAPAAGLPQQTQQPSGPTLQQILAMKNDGIPGNYQAGLNNFIANGGQSAQNVGAPQPLAAPQTQNAMLQLAPGQTKLAAVRQTNDLAIPPRGMPGGVNALGGTVQAPSTRGIVPQPVIGQQPAQGVPTPVGQTPVPPTGTPANNALSPQDAFKNFTDSAGMQFQLEQGANALNNLYAAHGALQSGAAMKALQGFGQQTALNNYFLPYLGLLGNQQSIGAGAASSIAGVGQNFGNTAASIAANQGAAIGNGADAVANAGLVRGANNANIYGGLGSALGNIGSSFLQSQQPPNYSNLNFLTQGLQF
jgi:hypothetical protein